MDNYERLDLVYWAIIDKAMLYDKKTETFMIKQYNVYRLTSSESINRAFRNLIKHRANLSRGNSEDES